MDSIIRTRRKIATLIFSLSTKLHNLDRFFIRSEADMKVFKVSALSTTLFLSGISSAHADDGLAGMMKKGADQASSTQESVAIMAYAFGFFGVCFGCYNLWRKGKEGENSSITGGKILVPMIGGACLAAVGFILDRTSETVDIDTSTYGSVK